MTTFFLFGSYTRDSIEGIDARRTKKAEEIVSGYGGTVRAVYALLGMHDIVIIVQLPGVPEAVQVSLALSKATGMTFTSAPAVTVADFDKLAEDALES
jgi:uncharacterized protein with GYD domain